MRPRWFVALVRRDQQRRLAPSVRCQQTPVRSAEGETISEVEVETVANDKAVARAAADSGAADAEHVHAART
jgi:hypothetical protein